MNQRTERPGLVRWLMNCALIAIIVFFGAPFVWVLIQAFDAATPGARLWPGEPTLENFRSLFADSITRTAFRNSLIVALSCMVFGTLLASLAGFGLSRLRMKRKNEFVFGILLLYAMPMTVTMVAIFELALRLDMTNSLPGLIVGEIALALPFLAWLMKGFYDTVPRFLDEATQIDGHGVFHGWAEVLTPAALPGIAVTAGLAFVIGWSDVLLPIVLISDPELATVSRFFFQSAESASAFKTVAALGVIYILPVAVVLLLLKHVAMRNVVRRESNSR